MSYFPASEEISTGGVTRLGADALCDKVIGLEVLADKVLGASWDPHYVRDGNKEGRKAGEHRDTSYCSFQPSIVIGQMAE